MTSSPRLSIILPWYRKLAEFRRVLPGNAEAWRRPDLEVLLVLDEPSEEAPLIELLANTPGIQWKVIVNDQPHSWRPPSRAINVGVRHAKGRFVLVASPESAYAGPVPGTVLQTLEAIPEAVVLGRVGFASLRELDSTPDLQALFRAKAASLVNPHAYYGLLGVAREAIQSIGGYNETFAGWGGEDDDLRVRLEMAGHPLLACPGLKVVHVSLAERPSARNPEFPFDPKLAALRCAPSQVLSPHPHAWGLAFDRVAYSTSPEPHEPGAEPARTREEVLAEVLLTVSMRTCLDCGRRIYHAATEPACPQCRGPFPLPSQTRKLLAERSARVKVLGILQVRNEESYLPGCLEHLRPFVDGFVVLDDGSTDGTRALLAQEPKLLALLTNPPAEPHRWNERENRRRLLTEARLQGADWVLCCDADERYEAGFLRRMRTLAAAFPWNGTVCVSLVLRELWDSPVRFRVDGPWGSKRQTRFFSLPEEISFDLDQDYHGAWFPDQVRLEGVAVQDPGCLYHLKTMFQSDRVRRRDFYKGLDPDRRFQAIGYDYLAEEGPGMEVRTIDPARGYDLSTLPEHLRI